MTGPPPDAVDGWIAARWSELARRVAQAPPEVARWARRELVADPVGAGLQDRNGWSVREVPPVDGDYDEVRDPRAREALGQFFTPDRLARLLVDVARTAEADWPSPVVLDPACGAGSLLVAVADARLADGWSPARALEAVEGWDRDPRAAWSARAALVGWGLDHAGGGLPPLSVHGGVDALGRTGRPGELQGVGAVVTNPPFLEAKRMRRAEPGLRERLRAEFPQLSGAFDLYLAFCWRALSQVGQGGSVALLLPNKVMQGRYAAPFRRALRDVHLAHLVDLARLRPRPFPGTSVYPAILHVRRAEPAAVRVHRVVTRADLAVPPHTWPAVEAPDLFGVGDEHPLFVPFDTWPSLAPLLDGPRLGDVASVVSTCSFHKKGLRERFVGPQRPDVHAFPYLGGPSRCRRTEVAPFRTRWAGWWIRYDAESLRQAWGNPLPSLERTFLRPKAIFCQHAPRMRVVADRQGRFVTKDVYPVAWPESPAWTLGRLVAVLSSTVFTALYNTVYQGIVVGGETYHYLPAFLKTIPVPEGDHPALLAAEPLVWQLHERLDPGVWRELDRLVAQAYGIAEHERSRMVEVHLVRVGAEAPG